MGNHWKCQSSLDEFSLKPLQELPYFHQELYFGRDAFKFCELPKNLPGLQEGKQTISGWITTVPLEESSISFPHTESFGRISSPSPCHCKLNIFPLQVLPLTNQNYWLLKWNVLVMYIRDTVLKRNYKGFPATTFWLKIAGRNIPTITTVLFSASLKKPIFHFADNALKYSRYLRPQMFLSKMQKVHKICL